MNMATGKNDIKLQIESKKNIMLMYLILGAGLFVVGQATASEIGPASLIFLLALIIAAIFYTKINSVITNPTPMSITGLKNTMYIFIVVFACALALDVFWWDYLTFTSFLGAVLAIAGYFVMNQVIVSANILASPQQATVAYNQPPNPTTNTKSKFCPSCGFALESSLASNFCPSCGQKI